MKTSMNLKTQVKELAIKNGKENISSKCPLFYHEVKIPKELQHLKKAGNK